MVKLTWIWKPTSIIDIRPRTEGGGFLFLAELEPDLSLHVGVGKEGVDFCGLFQGHNCVIWDKRAGFCQAGNFSSSWQEEGTNEFEIQATSLIRCNCFWAGAPVEATPEEKREWIRRLGGN
jgi:hypothetical protein